jgi:hypothetical protein
MSDTEPQSADGPLRYSINVISDGLIPPGTFVSIGGCRRQEGGAPC